MTRSTHRTIYNAVRLFAIPVFVALAISVVVTAVSGADNYALSGPQPTQAEK